jgi:hypothetical protein
VLLTLQAPPQDLTNIMHLDIGNTQYANVSFLLWKTVTLCSGTSLESAGAEA